MSDTTILQNSTQVKKYPSKALNFICLLNSLPTYCLALRMQKARSFYAAGFVFLCDLRVRVRLLTEPSATG